MAHKPKYPKPPKEKQNVPPMTTANIQEAPTQVQRGADLPANFKNDIESRDTALVPLVVIGNYGTNPNDWIWISTNQITLPYVTNIIPQVTYKPILLNIPSLKESIDIEKRNYKISSVNLDISNFPYEGKRFSELIEDSSLINAVCRIYWTSPSTTNVIPRAEYGSNNWTDGDAFQIYNGTIRRYTHDDEKVRLVVEDRSQATLHKDLPENVGTANVPDKYKNKYIPMVYGHVERSPIIPYYANIIEETEDVVELQLLADNRAITVNGFVESSQLAGVNDPLLTSALYFFDNNQYWNVTKKDDDGNVNFEYSIEDTGSIIRLDIDTVVEGESDTIINNDFSRGQLGVYVIRQIKKVVYIPQEVGGAVPATQFEDVDMGKLTGTIDVATNDAPDYTVALLRLWLDDINAPTRLATTTNDEGQTVEVSPVTEMYLHLTHYNYRNYTPSGESANQGDEYTNWRLWVQDQTISSDGVEVSTIEYTTLSYSNNSITGSDNPIDISDKFGALNAKQYVAVGMPKHNHSPSETIPDYSINVNFTLHDAFLVHRLFVNGVVDKDYYANVAGRGAFEVAGTGSQGGSSSPSTWRSPTAPAVIAHILENELGQSGIDATGTYDWQYAFTVDKKIDSKKLIEGIASASPYIPRFDNMGNFKFDVIKLTYTSSDHTIKEADVINFSFKRTPIEDVVTKVEFKYNWDYARGEFSSRRALDIIDWACADGGSWESFDYYGIPEDNLESTLVIDDDRGKYIRDDDTAEKFVCWMMSWYSNQHLIMKMKLPLKYMNIEIGNIVNFDYLLGDISPYGINYISQENGTQTFQAFFPYFMVTETNKRLDYVEISCIQMHQLWAEVATTTDQDGNMSYD